MSKSSPEVHERAVRMVRAQQGKFRSRWAAITFIATKIGCAPWAPSERVENGLELADRLDQRILGKAFADDLVSQDSNNEPDSDLLTPIRETHALAAKPKRGRRKKVAT